MIILFIQIDLSNVTHYIESIDFRSSDFLLYLEQRPS